MAVDCPYLFSILLTKVDNNFTSSKSVHIMTTDQHKIFTLSPFSACECNVEGSISIQCNSEGQCPCQPTVQGLKCDECKVSFYLTAILLYWALALKISSNRLTAKLTPEFLILSHLPSIPTPAA